MLHVLEKDILFWLGYFFKRHLGLQSHLEQTLKYYYLKYQSDLDLMKIPLNVNFIVIRFTYQL